MNFFTRNFFAIALGSLVLIASGCAMKHGCCGHDKQGCCGAGAAGSCCAEAGDKKSGSCGGGETKGSCGGTSSCGMNKDAKAGGSCGK